MTKKDEAEFRSDMRSFLEKHLADQDLGIERLSREFGASRSSIYREFAETGGVVHYITRRRLDRIFDQLHASPPSRGRVQEIANRWGFEDPGYFSRLFRRQFGVSPSKVMGIGYRPTSSGRLRSGIRDGQALSGWLRTI